MDTYSVNVITNDYAEILLTYSYSWYEEISDAIKEYLENMGYTYNSIDEFYNSKEFLEGLLSSCMDDVYNIEEKEDLNIVDYLPFKLRIVNSDVEKGIVLVISFAILDNEMDLKLPKFRDVSPMVKDENIDKEIEEMLSMFLNARGYFDIYTVDSVTDEAVVYVDIYGKEEKIYESDTFSLSCDITGKKIGDEIELINKKMNNRKEMHKITKIEIEKAKDLNDEIVKELNYKNCDNVEAFMHEFKKNFKKMYVFTKTLSIIYDKILEMNNIIVSKKLYNLFDSKFTPLFKSFSISMTERYNMIKYRLIEKYLNEYFAKQTSKLDTSYLNPYFREEYEIVSLLGRLNDCPLEEYILDKQSEANLYTLIKNGGKKHDK
ncbi:MAG: hypothetical protein J6W64_03225 [Bacilli bacterium]|nr:hypothetical protein [Bacilli bacterium]